MTRIASVNPANGEVVWEGLPASPQQIDRAVRAAQEALPGWAELSSANRAKHLHAFGESLKKHHAEFTQTICRETGKPRWEAASETDAVIHKIDATIEAFAERRQPAARHIGDAMAATFYKPFGVVAVLGPFNFPAHLPNGHIMPALIAGNTIVFKPSEMTPRVGERMVELWREAGLPAGVIDLVQGDRDAGTRLIAHPGIDGVFFTGSFEAGRAINRALAEEPGKIVALEMGGNNPLLVHKVRDLNAAAYWTIQSAYITAGQRCSCARRLIVVDGADAAGFLQHLANMMPRIRVGAFTDVPEPFMGPVISDAAAKKLLAAQEALLSAGARSIIRMESIGPRLAMLRPGLIDVTEMKDRQDEELFGPLLQVIRVKDVDAAITEANNTRYGLTAGLFSDDRELWNVFRQRVRAGVINWNRALTGASGMLPFGGVGSSGNNRPSAYFAADYCSYPVASMEMETMSLPTKLTPGIEM